MITIMIIIIKGNDCNHSFTLRTIFFLFLFSFLGKIEGERSEGERFSGVKKIARNF